MIKIGVLLPNSALYPGLSFDLVEGLKVGLLKADETETTLVIEGIGFGTDADDILAKAQKLLMQESVDMVLGMMSWRITEQLTPLFTAANRLLLVLDIMGEFFNVRSPGPTVFFHSLQSCLGARLAGRKAVESGAQQIIQAVSFYDAGYLQGYAVAQGVETNGGQMAQYVVSSHIRTQVTLEPLQAAMEAGIAQAVVALYAGDMAEHFYRLFSELPHTLPLWVSPMLLEEQMLATVKLVPDGVRGYVSWSERLGLPANTVFMEAIRQRGRQPTIFSLLGYEGGEIVATYLQTLGTRTYPVPADFQKLTTMTFTGPRGQIRFDPASHFSFGPFYAATLVQNPSGGYQLADLTEEPSVVIDEQQFRTEPPPMSHTGWHNTYLCI